MNPFDEYEDLHVVSTTAPVKKQLPKPEPCTCRDRSGSHDSDPENVTWDLYDVGVIPVTGSVIDSSLRKF